jgi:hypothetical protein
MEKLVYPSREELEAVLYLTDGRLYFLHTDQEIKRSHNANNVTIDGKKLDMGRIIRILEGESANSMIIYTHCEFCHKELPEFEKKMGAANHDRCWKIHTDRGRKKQFTDSLFRW